MNFTENLNNGVFIKFLNKKLKFFQEKLGFLRKNSYFIENLPEIITFLAFLTLIASTFLETEKLGLIILSAFALLPLKFITKKGSEIKFDILDLLVFLYVLFFCLATLF
jgi:hypothetical protein